MKFRRLFLFTEETVLYAFAVVLAFLGFAVALSMVGIIVAPLAILGVIGLVTLARHVDHDRRGLVPRH
ncbi:hypothetical protein [Streptomyces sp. UG1]|uniref:hypothetical protein n=1 Tax=Streptomyces sp. UG1 TaxID=3417652 RepID=UPI003CEB653E